MQTELDTKTIRNIKKFFYGWCFGWGVYFGHEYLLQALIKPKVWKKEFWDFVNKWIFVGGILWSTSLLILFFAIMIYQTFFLNQLVYFEIWDFFKNERIPLAIKIGDLTFWQLILFSTWNFLSIVLPDQQVILYNSPLAWVTTIEAFIGFIWMTIFVAIIVRKFMRM